MPLRVSPLFDLRFGMHVLPFFGPISTPARDLCPLPLLPALTALEGCPRVLRAGLAGDHLWAITPKDVDAATLENWLSQLGITIRQLEQVEPTLEDFFLALAKGREES